MHILLAQSLENCVLFGLVAFTVWLVAQRMKAQEQLTHLHLEQRGKLLDRFQDAEGLEAFVRSDEGRRLLLEAPHQVPPGLRMLQVGLLAIPVGSGLLCLGHAWLQRVKPAGDYLDAHFAFQGFRAELAGGLLLALGLGLLAGGLVARRVGRG